MSQSRLHYVRLFKHCKGVQYQTPLNFELFSVQKTHVNFSRSFCFLTSSFLNPTQPPRGPSAFTVSTLKHQLLLACVLHAAVSSSVSNTSDPLCFIGRKPVLCFRFNCSFQRELCQMHVLPKRRRTYHTISSSPFSHLKQITCTITSIILHC